MSSAARERPHAWARGLTVYYHHSLPPRAWPWQLIVKGKRVPRFVKVENTSEIVPSNVACVISRSYDFVDRATPWTKGYTGEDWDRMGTALRESSVLAMVKLDRLTEEAVEALFGEGGQWPYLDILMLRRGTFGTAGLAKILRALDPVSRVVALDLPYCNLGSSDMRLLANTLNQTQIRHLDIRGNRIDEEGLECILSAHHSRNLVRLYVGSCKLSDSGIDFLSRFLGREDTQLNMFYVGICGSNRQEEGKRKRMLVACIPKASKLELIYLGGEGERWLAEINNHLFDLVCDASSVEAVCNSNHTLYSLGWKRQMSGSIGYDLRENLQIRGDLARVFEYNWEATRRGSTAYAIRRKLEDFFFTKPDFELGYFNDIDVTLMPYCLAVFQSKYQGYLLKYQGMYKTRDISGVYRLLRNCHVSEMFSFPGPKSVATLLWEKDQQIKQLKQRLEQLEGATKEQILELKAENERLKERQRPPNKRARVGNQNV